LHQSSSCLIGLVHIDLFDLVKELFVELYIPSAVYEEVVVKGKGKIGADEIASAVQAGWLKKTAIRDTLAVNALTTHIGQGEAEVIILAQELGLDYALIDEKAARNVAALMNVRTTGVLGVLDIAIIAGFSIDKKAAVDQLRKVGFRISEKLYREILSK
jgi:predicted nucleic acid-binding protein